ncbi:hypothetical protein D3C87_2022160 [compost metagenome]
MLRSEVSNWVGRWPPVAIRNLISSDVTILSSSGSKFHNVPSSLADSARSPGFSQSF